MKDLNFTILGVETCSEICSAALWHNGLMAQSIITEPRSHSQKLIPMVQDLLKQAKGTTNSANVVDSTTADSASCGITMNEIDYIACSSGPGSFTGVRIGIGVAKGLAYGQDINIIPVSSLQALAYQALTIAKCIYNNKSDNDITNNDKSTNTVNTELTRVTDIVAIIDARMHELYFVHYKIIDFNSFLDDNSIDCANNAFKDYPNNILQLVADEKLLSINDIAINAHKNTLFIGNGVNEYQDYFKQNNLLTCQNLLDINFDNKNIKQNYDFMQLAVKYPLASSVVAIAKNQLANYISQKNIENIDNSALTDFGCSAIELTPVYLRNKVTF